MIPCKATPAHTANVETGAINVAIMEALKGESDHPVKSCVELYKYHYKRIIDATSNTDFNFNSHFMTSSNSVILGSKKFLLPLKLKTNFPSL